MALTYETGTFTKTTSTSTPVSQQVNLVDSSITPKIIILQTAGQTTSDGTFTDHIQRSYGWWASDSNSSVCQSYRSHETNENEAYVIRNDAIISIISLTAGSEVSRASVSSVAAGSFTLSYAVQSDTTAMVIGYTVIGGSDITNTSAFTGTNQDFSTGNHSWNGSGTSFTPDFALIMNSTDTGSVSLNTVSAGADQAVFSLGAASGTSNQWVLMFREETVGTADTDHYLSNSSCIGTMSVSSGAITYVGSFVSFNNAAGGGITINITDAANNTSQIGFLLVKGGVWEAGAFSTPATAQTQNVTLTNSQLTPNALSLFGVFGTTNATVAAQSYVGMGMTDGTHSVNFYTGSTNGVGTWTVSRSTDTSKVYRLAVSSNNDIRGQCSISDMSTAGQFSLSWDTADAARLMSYWTVGEVTTGTQYNRSPSAENTTISDSSLTRLLSAARIPSTDTSTISETSLTRMTQAFRLPSTDTSTVSEQSLTAAKVKSGIPSADTTTVTDSSLVRLLSSTRVPSTETETINDSSLTRMLSTSRAASDRVTVGEGSHLFVIHVPLYIYPFHWIPASEWYQLSDIMAANPDVLFILKLNVNSGPDTAVNTDYETGIDILKGQGNASHVKLIGYVYTSYGARAIADVKTDIDRWQTFYGSDINGIFLDEMENDAGEEAYYQELTNYIHNDKGMEISWGNPGVPIAESYVKANAVDVFQISESADYPTASAIENATFSGTYSPSKFAMGIHSVTSYNSSLISEFNTDVAYIFVTGDEMPTPYDTISAYLDDLALQANNIPKATKAITRIRAPTAEDNITISDVSLIRLLNSIRVPSTETEIISDSALTRIYSSLRLPSQDTTSLSEDITSEKTAGAQVIERAPSADSTTITESSLVRLYSSLRLPSTDTIIITEDSLVRLLQAFRTPEQDTITIGESVSGGKLFERVPSFDTTTITEDGISRLLSAARAADSDTIGLVDETLTRATQAFRTPSTDDITVSDTSLDRIKSLSRTPSTDSESVTDSSLTRLLSASRALEESENISDFSLTRLLSAIRIPSQDTTNLSEDVTGQHITAGQFNRSVGPDTVILTESSLTRLLQLARLPTTDTTDIIDSSLVGLRNLPRIPSTDTITISDSSLIRLLSLVRTPSLDSTSVIDSSLTRMLQSFRLPSVEVISVNESLSGGRIFPRIPTTENVTVTAGTTARALSSLRVIEESIESIEASLSRMLSSIRSLEDIVTISEVQAFLTQIRMIEETIITGDISLNTALVLVRSPFVESVTVSELLSTTGGTPSELVVYATVDEVRMLLGNLGAQRATNDINRAIEAATDTINRRTNRIPPYNWRSTEEEFDLIKKLARYIAALEMSIGISGFEESRTEMQKEIEEIFTIIEEHDPGGITSNDMVVTSESATYPSNTEEGIIWSTRYKDLGVKKRRIRFRR